MVQRDCLSDQVKRLLLSRILDNTYKAGDRLIELQIAREMNVSQGSVREALRELEALRLVESEPYRGTRVRGVNEQEMREAYQVRAALEHLAAKLGAPKFKGNTHRLQTEVNALRSAARSRDSDAYARHNQKFHALIVAAAGNAVLLRVWESLDWETRARITLAQTTLDLRGPAESHQPIVDALDRGDGKLAGKLLREHAESRLDLIPDRDVSLEPVTRTQHLTESR